MNNRHLEFGVKTLDKTRSAPRCRRLVDWAIVTVTSIVRRLGTDEGARDLPAARPSTTPPSVDG